MRFIIIKIYFENTALTLLDAAPATKFVTQTARVSLCDGLYGSFVEDVMADVPDTVLVSHYIASYHVL